ncbi:MAG: bifunctional riboflavin kinase/FAD synthetase [Deltaproteobacteria bacterium]|nr:bifunctional riboflavin kinase/FAD synthetase [Deltaproteobacteria bacterium]
MKIIYDLKELDKPLENPVLTIGNFDGVHKGHLALFDLVKKRAAAIGGCSVVMTFEPHPIKLTNPGKGLLIITPIKQKLRLISEAGIDVTLCLPFDRQFSTISANDFVKNILVDKIGIREIVVGYDYSFGNNRQGNIGLLKRMGKELGFKVHTIEPIHLKKVLVSSTSIRNFIKEGDLEHARVLLGRDYQITGRVISGAGRGGKLLGFPTANLLPVDELIPKKGVYAVIAEIDSRQYFGVCNIGNNPTFGENVLSIETHMFDFNGETVGKDLTIRFMHRLRDEKTFSGIEELSAQISRDIQKARELFNLNG